MPSKETKQLNTLKTRDDHRPVEFTVDGAKFKLQAGTESSWLNTEEFGHKELRSPSNPG